MNQGRFIVLEGLDGAGTTTQTGLLHGWLETHGHNPLSTREPTDGAIGRIIRQTLRGGEDAPSQPVLPWLFAADRADHLDRTIEPALATGMTVISDRYYHSSLAYQSLTLPLERVHALNADFRVPDITFFVDVPIDICLNRLSKRAEATGETPEIYEVRDRLEKIDAAYRDVLSLLWSRGEAIVLVDGTASPDAVAAEITRTVTPLLRG